MEGDIIISSVTGGRVIGGVEYAINQMRDSIVKLEKKIEKLETRIQILEEKS